MSYCRPSEECAQMNMILYRRPTKSNLQPPAKTDLKIIKILTCYYFDAGSSQLQTFPYLVNWPINPLSGYISNHKSFRIKITPSYESTP